LLQPSVGTIIALYQAVQQLKGCSARLNKLSQRGVRQSFDQSVLRNRMKDSAHCSK